MSSKNEDTRQLAEEIGKLKSERRALILAHYYQRPEVQEIADFVGDSLQLARQAAAADADVIVFCGVYFMAESAKILSPEKIVLLPEEKSGCPLADTADAEAVRAKKEEISDCIVVTYVNSSAAVKAESDIVCTSSNAVQVVNSLPEDKQVLFVPDRNLGHYVAEQTGRPLILWDGSCSVHDNLSAADLEAARSAHPDAEVMVHPECCPEVIELADYVSSTGGMIKYAQNSPSRSFIVGTEKGILYPLRKLCPDRTFYPAAPDLICPDMKLTTLNSIKKSLEEMKPQIQLDAELAARARQALNRMLEIS
jgi:quinolinate synthase